MLALSGESAIACCVCKRIKLDNGMYVRFDDLTDSDFTEFCKLHAKQTVSHTYCPACYTIVREELAKYKEEKKRIEEANSQLPNIIPENKRKEYDPSEDRSCDSC